LISQKTALFIPPIPHQSSHHSTVQEAALNEAAASEQPNYTTLNADQFMSSTIESMGSSGMRTSTASGNAGTSHDKSNSKQSFENASLFKSFGKAVKRQILIQEKN
jgi:hypothetical protein